MRTRSEYLLQRRIVELISRIDQPDADDALSELQELGEAAIPQLRRAAQSLRGARAMDARIVLEMLGDPPLPWKRRQGF